MNILIYIILGTSTGTVQHVQQRVQILRGPDGKLQVRGLMPGQQLVQMPDGKLHVLNTAQAITTTIAHTTGTTSSTPTTQVFVLYSHIIIYNELQQQIRI